MSLWKTITSIIDVFGGFPALSSTVISTLLMSWGSTFGYLEDQKRRQNLGKQQGDMMSIFHKNIHNFVSSIRIVRDI